MRSAGRASRKKKRVTGPRAEPPFERSAGEAAPGDETRVKYAWPGDPNYLDAGFHPALEPGETWAQARRKQVEAIKAAEARTGRQTDAKRSGQHGSVPYQGSSALGAPEAPSRIARKRAKAKRPVSTTSEILRGSGMSLRQAFPELVPSRPFCANDFAEGIRIRPRGQALRRLHVQFNHPKFIRWLLLDLDRADAYFRDEDALLPAFNVLIRNPANGHAHAAYVLDVPVAAHDAARQKPLKLLAAVERGLVRRLAADRAYSGLLAKNPLHPHWKVEWRRKEPYSLEELTGWLSQEDMRPEPEHESSGHGRNCALFDQLRGLAYREVLPFKRAGGSAEAWRARLSKAAANTNSGFAEPLGTAEVRGIAKSVAKWTWNSFSAARFSAIQAERAKKRWQGHKAESAIKPWLEMGISERTYYRRKKDGKVTVS